jgi:hypothetical protein
VLDTFRLNDSVHYHDVDDAANTHFVMASMWNAGVRIFDVRNPQVPAEVAYFNPGDVAPPGGPTKLDHVWGHIHYDATTGNIWFASAIGGFFVVRMEDQVHQQLQLPGRVPPAPATHIVKAKDAGWPGTKGIRVPINTYDFTPYYCTLAPLAQRW